MNYLLTFLHTPVTDNEFIVGVSRFMSPIVETDGRYVQYDNGLMLYHFDTKLDITGVRDHIDQLVKSFGVYVILNEINSNTTFCIEGEHVDGLLNLGPDISIENFPFIIYPQFEEPDMEDEDDDDMDDVVQKLMMKYRVVEKEPTLDEILEKVHSQGVDSLTIQEIAILKNA